MENEKPDYSKTVNLPQTEFPMKANLPQREPGFLKDWEEQKTYAEVRRKNNGRKKFILHDGPPYANGHIHLGTSLNKILKDFIIKYKSMSGSDAPYTPGWDCHGLPIEQQALKELKLDKHKVDMMKFRKQAAEFAKKFIDIQRNEFKRLGVFADWEKPYLTLDPKYEGVILRVFGELAKNGFIYRSKKPVYWCPSCETALADAEVEYADHVSHSIYVKFAVKQFPEGLEAEDGVSVLIWTTTPWTLPANVALAFNAEAQYALVKAVRGDGVAEKLILSRKLLPAVMEKAGIKDFQIVREFTGRQLEGIACANPVVDRQSVGVLADFVSLEDGTGVVHIAPGHGQDDYQVGLKYKLPVLSPVNAWGGFTDEVPEFKGQKVFAANPLIIEKLKNNGSLVFEEKFTHSYPHCWRCKKPIIFRATPQWFMSVEHGGLRAKMLELIKKVSWVPAYGENRITGMIETRPDWCLSRQRLWGVPLPVFYCEDCGEPLLDYDLIMHVSALVSEHGSDYWFEKSAAEIISPLAAKCAKCGGTDFRKEQDILDVWFDSGVSSEAVLASGNFEGLSWPADMYLEGSDQHRGWFQTSLIPASALKQAAPYRSVLTHGFVVDGEGKKMSKSVGNTIAPEEIITKYGADILRLWVATSDYREDIRISQEIIKGLVDTYRKIRNTLRFLLGNIYDFTPEDALKYEEMRELDRHCLWQLQETVKQVTNAYETFEFHRAAGAVSNFCTVYLSGFYLDALKDTLYCEKPGSKARRSAQTAIRETCSVMARLLAPILSFTAEEVWRELRKTDAGLPVSVFLAEFPVPDDKTVFTGELSAKWGKLFALREKTLLKCEELRKEKMIGSTLEASLNVFDNGDLRAIDRELLCCVTGTWDVAVSEVSDAGSKPSGVEVSAGVSKHAKCERCWRHKQDVSSANKFASNLCGRCAETLER